MKKEVRIINLKKELGIGYELQRDVDYTNASLIDLYVDNYWTVHCQESLSVFEIDDKVRKLIAKQVSRLLTSTK